MSWPFSACTQMVMKNMQYYNALLLSGTPLFVVGVLLSPPEISLFPHGSELAGMMMQAIIDIVEGLASHITYYTSAIIAKKLFSVVYTVCD